MTRMGFIQDELDLKLLVMYIMARAAGPITFLQLYDIALCDAGVDYFSLNQAVQHLVTTGNLQKDGDLFSPTEKGRRNSEITDSSLPYSVRAKCDENLVALNDALRRQQQVAEVVCSAALPSGRGQGRRAFPPESGPALPSNCRPAVSGRRPRGGTLNEKIRSRPFSRRCPGHH